jgi:hypothetical protein
MSWVYLISGGWLLHCALGGGLLLLVAWGLMRRTAQPARQQRLGEWGLVAALLVALLSLCPAWLVIPIRLAPSKEVPATSRVEATPSTKRALGLPQPGTMGNPRSTEIPQNAEKGEGIPLDISRWRLTVPSEEMEPRPTVPLAAPTLLPTTASEQPLREAPSQTLGFVPATPWLASFLAPLERWLGLAWSGVAVLLLGRWLLGHLLLWRLVARADPPPEAVIRLFAEMAPGPNRPRLRISRRLRVPLSCGLLRPTILLPEALCEPTPALRWILAHELTHLERRDVWTCLLFGIGQVIYFYLPWFWWLRRQVGLCQEYLADAAVADQEARPEEYAEFLVSLTTGPAAPAVATGVSGRPSDLFRRVTMLLQPQRRLEKQCPRLWSGMAAGGLSLAAILVAGVGLTAAPVTVESGKNGPGVGDEKRSAMAAAPPSATTEPAESHSEPAALSPGHDMNELAPKEVAPPVAGVLRPRNPQQGLPGVTFRPPDNVMADQLSLPPDTGLVVERVDTASAAARAELREHDILLALDGHAVSRFPADLMRILDQIPPGTAVEGKVLRKGKQTTIRGLIPVPTEAVSPSSAFGFVFPSHGEAVGGGFPTGATVMTTLAWVENRFTTRHQEGTLAITITGQRAGSELRVTGIDVVDGVVAFHFNDTGSVPAQYGDKARYLLELSAAANPLPRTGAP